MKHSVRNYLIFATAGIFIFATAGIFALSVTALAASPPMNVRGTIAQVDGNTIDIKERDGGVAKIHLADNAKIVSVANASLTDIKPGSFIGTAATPGTDGKLQAIEVHIFPESMRGTGEGDRAWDLTPKSSMTNGTVAPKSSMTNGTVAEKSDKLPSAKTEPLRQCNLRRENRTGRVRALAHASPPSRRSGSRFAFDRAGFRQAYQSV